MPPLRHATTIRRVDETYETLAVLLRPQGRRGELLADTHTPDLTRFRAGSSAFVVPAGLNRPPEGEARTAIEEMWEPSGRNAGRIVVKLAGCDSIDAAERLAGHKLLVPLSERPALVDDDTFYVSDLIGATLYNAADRVGDVTDVEFATTPDGRTRIEDAAPLLVVETAAGEGGTILVPFIRAQLREIDIPGKRIVMSLPEGLLDLTTPHS